MTETLPAVSGIRGAIEAKQKQIWEILPSHINKDRFIKSAMIAAYENPAIRKCEPASIVAAVYNAAELGLDFIKAKGHAYLVPFGDKATFLPGYRGLMELARRSGLVTKIDSHVVYANEHFELEYGLHQILVHKPIFNTDRGERIGVYAVGHIKDGEPIFVFLDKSDIDKVRKVSKMKDGGIWSTWTDEMWIKSAIRKLFKFLPCSPDLERALEADNQAYDMEQKPPLVQPEPVKPPRKPRKSKKVEPTEAAPEEPVAPLAQPPKTKENLF